MMATSRVDVLRRLAEAARPSQLTRLGFRGPDVSDLMATLSTVLAREPELALVATLADRLRERIGQFRPTGPTDVWGGLTEPLPAGRPGALEPGRLALLALLVTAPDVAAYHAARGISPEVSVATLADLGQQVWVHRLTYDVFGLHTQGWLRVVWSGALYRLGRLQFNLDLDAEPGQPAHWVLSTHIPRTGPLTPERVDASLATARTFFADHFPDHPTRDFHCRSWLLDPALAAELPGSNLAAFQRRWRLSADRQPGDADVLFFVFGRRGSVDPASLPTDTALRMAVVHRWAAGQSWFTRSGRLPQ